MLLYPIYTFRTRRKIDTIWELAVRNNIYLYIYIFVFIYVLLLYCGLLNKLCYSLGFTFIQNWKKQRVGEHDPPIRTRIARRSF